MMAPRLVRTSLISLMCWLITALLMTSYAAAYQEKTVAGEDGRQKLDALELTADEIYQHVKKGEMEQSLLRLQLLHKQLAEVQLLQYTTIDGAKALIDSLVELKRLLVAIEPDLQASEAAAVRVRLALDALKSQGEPMWRQYYKPLKSDVDDLESLLKANNETAASAAFKAFLEHYNIVRPSIVISVGSSDIAIFDALLTSLERSIASEKKPFEQAVALLQQVKEELAALFGMDGDKTTFMPLPGPRQTLYWSTLIGSLIGVVLAYVAYLKFRHDRGYVSVTTAKEKREPFMRD